MFKRKKEKKKIIFLVEKCIYGIYELEIVNYKIFLNYMIIVNNKMLKFWKKILLIIYLLIKKFR